MGKPACGLVESREGRGGREGQILRGESSEVSRELVINWPWRSWSRVGHPLVRVLVRGGTHTCLCTFTKGPAEPQLSSGFWTDHCSWLAGSWSQHNEWRDSSRIRGPSSSCKEMVFRMPTCGQGRMSKRTHREGVGKDKALLDKNNMHTLGKSWLFYFQTVLLGQFLKLFLICKIGGRTELLRELD